MSENKETKVVDYSSIEIRLKLGGSVKDLDELQAFNDRRRVMHSRTPFSLDDDRFLSYQWGLIKSLDHRIREARSRETGVVVPPQRSQEYEAYINRPYVPVEGAVLPKLFTATGDSGGEDE